MKWEMSLILEYKSIEIDKCNIFFCLNILWVKSLLKNNEIKGSDGW